MQLAPGDLTVSQIQAVFVAFEDVRRLALEGASEREIAEVLEWRRIDVRHAARLMGFTVSAMVQRQTLCPKCGHLSHPDGHCEVCVLRVRLERLSLVNAEEHRREEERKLERAINAMKSDTRHVRERMGTNPRKGAQEE